MTGLLPAFSLAGLGSRIASFGDRFIPAENEPQAGQLAPRSQDVLFVLLLSGLCGLFLGMASGWQLAIESAQVVAGIVEYPRDNPFAMYHLKTWTLLHQIPAAFLALGVSEQVLTMCMGGLVGMVSFPALALCTYAVCGNRLVSSAVPLIVLGTKTYHEASSIYPVRILSDAPWVLYGCIATALVLLVWSLIGVGAKRSGAFLMGLSPAIHPTLGCWCLGVGLAVFAWSWLKERESPRVWAPFLIAGLFLATCSLGVHLVLSRDVPTVPSEIKAQYVAAFAANWDSHRKPFPMDHRVTVMACVCIVLCGLSLRYFQDRMPRSSRFLFRAMLLSATLGIGLCVSTQWQEYLPTVVLMAMPGRYINLAGLAFPAICLGMLYRHRPSMLAHLFVAGLFLYLLVAVQRFELGRVHVPLPASLTLACSFALIVMMTENLIKSHVTSPSNRWLRLLHYAAYGAMAEVAIEMVLLRERPLSMVLWTMFAVLLLRRPLGHFNWLRGLQGWLEIAIALCLFGVGWLTLGFPFTACLCLGIVSMALFRGVGNTELQFREIADQGRAPIRVTEVPHYERGGNYITRGFALAGGALSVLLAIVLFSAQASTAHAELADWRNDPVYGRAYQGHGFLLTASTVRATQLRTRRPILLEGVALNQLPYVPESGPSMNHILKRLYGEDLFEPRPPGWQRSGGLLRESGRKLWESREPEEWESLAREFGFTEIVTHSTWRLKLPLAACSKQLRLYRLPSADPRIAGKPHGVDSRK